MNAQADIARLVRELRKRTGLTQEKTRHDFSEHKLLGEWLPPLAMQKIEELLRSMGGRGSDILGKLYIQDLPYQLSNEQKKNNLPEQTR